MDRSSPFNSCLNNNYFNTCNWLLGKSIKPGILLQLTTSGTRTNTSTWSVPVGIPSSWWMTRDIILTNSWGQSIWGSCDWWRIFSWLFVLTPKLLSQSWRDCLGKKLEINYFIFIWLDVFYEYGKGLCRLQYWHRWRQCAKEQNILYIWLVRSSSSASLIGRK